MSDFNIISENANIGTNLKIGKFCIIEDGVTIGNNVSLGNYCIIKKGAIIGDNCKFSSYCEVRDNCVIGEGTSFGSRCTISANARIGKHSSIKYSFVLTDTPNLEHGNQKAVGTIGDNVLIGANVTLMPGFSIGSNSIIGACSQVRSNVGENEVWFGSPAKFFKKRIVEEY